MITLEYGDRAGQHRVQREHDVVQLHRIDPVRVALEVGLLDARAEVEAQVEAAVEQEADDVEAEEVKVEADDAFASPVGVDLRVEWDWPGREVRPADNEADPVQGWVVIHRQQRKRVLHAAKVAITHCELRLIDCRVTPLNRATSGPTLFGSNKRREPLSGGLI